MDTPCYLRPARVEERHRCRCRVLLVGERAYEQPRKFHGFYCPACAGSRSSSIASATPPAGSIARTAS
jgi:hypothetical protein